MVRPGLGMRGFLGFGEESTYGTAVSRTNWLEINSETLVKESHLLESAAIIRRGIVNTKVGAGPIRVAGEIAFDVAYDGWMKLAKHAFGTVSSTQPDVTNAPTAYNHKFTVSDSLPTGLTIEVFRDSQEFVTEPNKSFLYAGCKVNSFSFSCSADEIAKASVGIIGQDESRVAKSTDSYSTAKLALFHHGSMKWNSNESEVSAVHITLTNNYGLRPKVGSRFSREPVPESKMTVTGSFTMEFVSWNEYDDFVNATERQLVIDFTGPLIQGSIYNQIKLTAAVSIIDNVRVMLNAPGRIMLEIDFKAYRTASANELQLDMRNTSSSA